MLPRVNIDMCMEIGCSNKKPFSYSFYLLCKEDCLLLDVFPMIASATA